MQWEVVRSCYSAIEQQALGACVESFQGHAIGLSPHDWHLNRDLRAFLARLIVLFSSSELDVRATAHIRRCGQAGHSTKACQPTWSVLGPS
jgi:hypothetical protein